MKSAVVRLTTSATRTLPRWLLRAICMVYAVTGLFGRDPWKNEDAAGFGIMWTLANGSWQDWLLPNLAGKAITSSGPLSYWLGAISLRLFGPWLNPIGATHIVTAGLLCISCAFVWYSSYLLGRRAEVQPFKYAFGGEPSSRDYGRTLADGALLILLGCFGMAERSHETTPEITQLACITIMLYGLIRSIDKPKQGALWWGLALGLLLLAANPALLVALLLSTAVLMLVTRELRSTALLTIGLPVLALTAIAWPLTAYLALAGEARVYLHAWIFGNIHTFSGSPASALFYALKNLPLYTWPAWPLAAWSWYSWAGLRRAPHVTIALSVISALLILIALQTHETNRLFLLLLPALSILAAFALPTLKRGTINAIDWFALLSFTILGSFVWIVWIAQQTGFPAQIAHNLARLAPGFQAEFRLPAFIIAILVTGCWIALVHWRLARHPKVLWRSVILSSAGTTLMWVLLMTLWLPLVNYSRTYRDVAAQIAHHLPTDYQCISPVRLGDAQIASFAYFGAMRFAFDHQDCDVLLRQDTWDYGAPASLSPFVWTLVWEGRRPADRDERFRLYVRSERVRKR